MYYLYVFKYIENDELKQRLRNLYENGELANMVHQSRSNPFTNVNWSGYSGFAAVQGIRNDYPELWNAIQMLQREELSGFAHRFINERFPKEDLDYGTIALNRLQYIEALIAKDMFACK